MKAETPNTHQKALQINLDAKRYGTFAEIGGGQEVARWFFRVGGASGTVAKTISAYDMGVSDAIYGPAERYVSRQRLEAMLAYEFNLLVERLQKTRGDRSTFFVFADTVATTSYSRKEEGRGWLGVRFQGHLHEAPSEIVIHARLLEPDNWREQEALGILGVNLLHGAFYHHRQPEALVQSLMDELSPARVEIDTIRLHGPCFASADNRLLNLLLVQKGFSPAVIFTAGGETVQPAEVLYKKPVLVERGSFRPVTRTTLAMLDCARNQLLAEPRAEPPPPCELMEMAMRTLIAPTAHGTREFLARVDLLTALGRTVLVSNFGPYHQLVAYLSRLTKQRIAVVMGIPGVRNLLEKESYAMLEGGLLESLGRLFKHDVRLYVHPWRDPQSGEIVTAETLKVAPRLRHLYAHLLENHFLLPLQNPDPALLDIRPADVRARILAGDPAWEEMVPPGVANTIKRDHLFGWNWRGGA